MKRVVLIFAVAAVACGQGTPKPEANAPVRTSTGWKTARVQAARWGSDVRLDFPLNPNDGDRSEVRELVEKARDFNALAISVRRQIGAEFTLYPVEKCEAPK